MTLDNTQEAKTDPTANFITSGLDTIAEAQKSASVKSDKTADESETSENESESLDENTQDESAEDTLDNSESKDKKQTGIEKRFKKFSKKLSESQETARKAQLDAEFWRAKALGSETAPKETENLETKSIAKSDEPDPNDYETNAQYIKDLVKWNAKQEVLAQEENNKIEKVKSEYQKKQDTHNSRVSEYMEKNPSYKEDISNFLEEHGDVNFSAALHELILDSELGTAVLHNLAKNKDEFDRINSLSPLAAAREFGKLELKLSKDSPSTEIKTSKAPAPISPVGSKASAATTKALNDPTISFAEYESIRMKQLSKK